MAEFQITSPDGQKFKVTAPEGASQDEVLGFAQKHFEAVKQVAEDPITRGAQAVAGASPEALIAGSQPVRFALGAAAPVLGAAQIGERAYGGDAVSKVIQAIEKLKTEGMQAYGKEGTDWTGIAGSALSPVPLGAAKALPKAAGFLDRVKQGVTYGAGAGASMPVTNPEDPFWTTKAEQGGTGAALGTLFPVAGALARGGWGLAKGAYHAVEPVFEGGREAILRRYQEGLLGDSKSAVVDALVNATTKQRTLPTGQVEPSILGPAKAAGELVPGSVPTAGEAVANVPGATGLAAHQAVIAKTPGVSGEFVARGQAQEGAREAALGGIAKDKTALTAAESARAAAARANYSAAGGVLVKADSTLKDLMQRPSMENVLSRAKDLAKERGEAFQIGKDVPAQETPSLILNAEGKPATLTTTPAQVSTYTGNGLHYIKMAMDDLIKNPERFGIGASEANAIMGTKREFVNWLGEKNPAYEAARAKFAQDSIPINQMQVGQTLLDKLVAPLSGKERAAAFAQAVRDAPRTIKSSTGSSIFDSLDQILSPRQMQSVEGVSSDLARKASYEDLARGTNLGGGTDITGGVTGMHLPNLLSRPAMIANYLMRRLGQGADEKINVLAGKQYLDPKLLAESLKDAPPSVANRVIDAIMKAAGYPRLGLPATIGLPTAAAAYTEGH